MHAIGQLVDGELSNWLLWQLAIFLTNSPIFCPFTDKFKLEKCLESNSLRHLQNG